jgi:hypothetical protein
VLFDAACHAGAWDPERALALIERIVRDTEAHFSPQTWWPVNPRDVDPDDAEGVASTTLYFGAAGVVWALDRLRRLGAAPVSFEPPDTLLADNREWLRANDRAHERAAYLIGDTPIELMAFRRAAERLAELIAANREHPSCELMWGAPGTMLAQGQYDVPDNAVSGGHEATVGTGTLETDPAKRVPTPAGITDPSRKAGVPGYGGGGHLEESLSKLPPKAVKPPPPPPKHALNEEIELDAQLA